MFLFKETNDAIIQKITSQCASIVPQRFEYYLKKKKNIYTMTTKENTIIFSNITQENINEIIPKIHVYFRMVHHGINFVTSKRVDNSATEKFIANAFKRFYISVCILPVTDYISNVSALQHKISFVNLKINHIQILQMQSFNNLYGYTFDLIDYVPTRKYNILKNINMFNTSFIVEPPQTYKINPEKANHMFQCTKIKPFEIKPIQSQHKCFVHIGRVNFEREEMLKNIANFFPDINLYIFTLEPFLTEQKNIKFETKFIEGQELYTLINQHDTVMLSFSERPKRTYYSNRIPMLCGYQALIVQQYFHGIEKYFSEKEMIVFKTIPEIKAKLETIWGNYTLQQQYRNFAYEKSKQYSFENYVNTIINTL